MATDVTEKEQIGEINKYNFRTETHGVFKAQEGLESQRSSTRSPTSRSEPDWMRDFRLESLEIFEQRPMPKWGGAIDIDFQDIFYYLKPTDHQGKTWDDVPAGDQGHVRQTGHSRSREEVSRRA